MPEPTVLIENQLLPAEILVAVSPGVLVNLAERESEPLVVIGIQPHPSTEGAYELILRRPERSELQAAIMQRFKVAGDA